MNLLQLVLKQMRQRALSTWLTLLSVALGVALAVAILILERESRSLFTQQDYGFDLVLGAKGSATQMVLNSVYHVDQPPGTLPYTYVEGLRQRMRGMVRWRVPFAVLADNYQGYRVLATEPSLFRADNQGNPANDANGFAPRHERPFEFADGRSFHIAKFEAVIGHDVARGAGLKMGDKFQAAHEVARPGFDPHVHAEEWTVVGILRPTGTSFDRLIYVPLISTYTIKEHEQAMVAQSAAKGIAVPAPAPPAPATKPDDHAEHEHGGTHDHDDHAHSSAPTTTPAAGEDGHDHDHDQGHDAVPTTNAAGEGHDDHDHGSHDDHAAHGHDDDHHDHLYHLEPDGTIALHLPKEQWMVSGAFVKATAAPMALQMVYAINNGLEAQAANPAMVMHEFLEQFLTPSTTLLVIVAVLVIVVAGVSILVSIYNSIAARTREIAILRALGATRGRILAIICTEATLIGLIGGVLGVILGHAIAAVGSAFMERLVGQGMAWHRVSSFELHVLLGAVVLAFLAGLVPALKAYRTPVADNLASA